MATYTLSNFRSLPVHSAEEMKALELGSGEVLIHAEDIRVRRTNLDKAISLARSEKYATAIVVKGTQGMYRTETTVTAVLDGFVYTGSGLKIPMERIISVDFYSK